MVFKRVLFVAIGCFTVVEANRHDNPPDVHAGGSLVEDPTSSFVEEHDLAKGTAGKCPRMEFQLESSGGQLPSLVLVTIKSAQKLPWGLVDKADPHVEFWMGEEGVRQSWFKKLEWVPGHKTEKYWRARTQTLNGNRDPSWNFQCLLAYDDDSKITFQVWDHDLLTRNDFIGIASGNLKEILGKEDTRGDGQIDVKFSLKKKDGTAIGEGEDAAVLNVEFQVVQEKSMYAITKGTGNVVTTGMAAAGDTVY